MDRLKKLLAEAGAVLSRMSPAQKATMAMLAVTVVLALGVIAWVGGRSQYVTLAANLEQTQLEEIAAALESRGEEYKVEGNSVRVPASRRPYLARSLISEKVIPEQKVIDYQTYLQEGNVFTTRDRRRTLERLAQATAIERMIASLDKVGASTVVLSAGEPSGLFGEGAGGGASVSVTMRGGHELDQTTVNSIMGIVRSAVRRVDPQKITVVDTRTGRSHSKADADSAVTAGGDLFKLKRSVEDSLADKVRRIFMTMSVDCTVEVNAELDLDKVRERKQDIDIEKSIFDIERSKTSDSGGNVADGGVGLGVNIAGGTTSGGRSGSGRTSKTEKSRMQPAFSYLVQDIVRAPNGIAKVTAAVVLFDRTVERKGKRSYDEGYFKKYEALFKAQIVKAIGAASMEDVALMYIPSHAGTPAPVDAPEPVGARIRAALDDYSVLLVFGAVVLSLAFLYSIAHRSGRIAEPEGGEESRRRRRGPIIPPPSPELARLRQMQSQVRQVVQADPAAAAALIKRWMINEE